MNNEKEGVYICASCGNKLFLSEHKFDARDGYSSFTEARNEKSLEFAGQKVRCAKCKARLGSVTAGAPLHYRIDPESLDFEETEKLELEMPEDDDKGDEKNEEGNKKKPTADNPATSFLKSLSVFFGGTALGAVAGAIGAYMICQSFCNTQTPTDIQATSSGSAIPTPSSGVSPPRTAPIAPVTNTNPASTTPAATGAIFPAALIATSTPITTPASSAGTL